MQFKTLVASTILLASSASATMEASSSMAMSPMATSVAGAGQVKVQVVQVGGSNGSLAYYPDKITAEPGTMVQFQFMPKNHTVTQSAFDTPCVPLSQTNASAASTMIKSGFMPTTQSDTQRPVFTVMVNNTMPTWIFCGQTGHCQKGMVMVINENAASGKTLEAFKAKAAQFQGASGSASGTGSAGGAGGAGGASATSSSGPAQQTTNAAARPAAVGFTAIVGLLIAGLFLF